MAVKIAGVRDPRYHASSGDMHQLLGVRKLPDEGMDVREIQGVQVYVKPRNPKPTDRRVRSSKHRVIAICTCGQHVPVGRLHQHKCKE